MTIMEVNVIPLGTETPSVDEYVTRAVKILKEAGVKYQVTPMSTIKEKPSVSYPRRLFGSTLKCKLKDASGKRGNMHWLRTVRESLSPRIV